MTTHWSRDKYGRHFRDFQIIFPVWILGYCGLNFTAVYSWEFRFWWPSKLLHTPFVKSNSRFFSDTKINMMPSSNLCNFWWVHKMHANVHLPCIICRLLALTRSAPGSKCGKRIFFFESSLNIIVNFLLKLDGFKSYFLNFKLDTFS